MQETMQYSGSQMVLLLNTTRICRSLHWNIKRLCMHSYFSFCKPSEKVAHFLEEKQFFFTSSRPYHSMVIQTRADPSSVSNVNLVLCFPSKYAQFRFVFLHCASAVTEWHSSSAWVGEGALMDSISFVSWSARINKFCTSHVRVQDSETGHLCCKTVRSCIVQPVWNPKIFSFPFPQHLLIWKEVVYLNRWDFR